MSDRDERAERLAAQLRANLKRRKAQARAAAGQGDAAAEDADPAMVRRPPPHSDPG